MSFNIDIDNKPVLTGPWYLHHKHWNDIALDYIYAYEHIPPDATHHIELNAYVYQSIYRLIYESNLLEGEGLSKGETKRIADEYFPHLPSSYDSIKKMAQVCKTPFDLVFSTNCESAIDDICSKYDNLIPTISFKNKSRGFKEVVQHHMAYMQSNVKSSRYMSECYKRFLSSVFIIIYSSKYNIPPSPEDLAAATHNDESMTTALKTLDPDSKLAISILNKLNMSPPLDFKYVILATRKLNVNIYPVSLFTEDGIKSLHKTLARGLIDKDAGVPAGEYRIDNRIVRDLDVIFPSPELIPECMHQFISRANSLIDSLCENPQNLFEVAARVSHEFVRIHPFPDFNGRLSRLLLTVILNTFGVPFPVTLRGDKKGRHRYLSSLRKANKSHLKPYITLIAMRVAESFMEIDANLSLAGLPSVLTFLKRT